MVVAIVIIVVVLGSGIGVAFFVGRRGGIRSGIEQSKQQRQPSQRNIQELQRCLELSDCVARDSEALSGLLASQSPSVDRPVADAVQQFIKTAKNLAWRLNQMGCEAGIPRPQHDLRPPPPIIDSPQQEPAPLELSPAYLEEAEVNAAASRPAGKQVRMPASPFEDARHYPRSNFRGSAKATIYPRHPGPGREPISCTVLTRDLSCGGIGIAHSDQLFPKQIIVLDAVGKLLVGEVRWCRRADEHFYVAGCRLVKTNH